MRYHDRDGVERSVVRQICWRRGFGFYVRWNKYWLIVDPLATEISAD